MRCRKNDCISLPLFCLSFFSFTDKTTFQWQYVGKHEKYTLRQKIQVFTTIQLNWKIFLSRIAIIRKSSIPKLPHVRFCPQILHLPWKPKFSKHDSLNQYIKLKNLLHRFLLFHHNNPILTWFNLKRATLWTSELMLIKIARSRFS